MENNKGKKDKTFTLRLTEHDKGILNKISDDSNTSISDFLRGAMRNYLLMFYINPKIGNPQMVFSKNLVARIFSFLSDDEILEIADISFENSQKSFKQYRELISKAEKELLEGLNFKTFLKMSKMAVYSSKGQNWLDNMEFMFRKNEIIIIGSHDLGENFSKFFNYIMEKHAGKYDYELSDFKFQRKNLSITDKTKKAEKDHFFLHYSPNGDFTKIKE